MGEPLRTHSEWRLSAESTAPTLCRTSGVAPQVHRDTVEYLARQDAHEFTLRCSI